MDSMQTFKIQTIHEKIKNDSASLRIQYIVDFFSVFKPILVLEHDVKLKKNHQPSCSLKKKRNIAVTYEVTFRSI